MGERELVLNRFFLLALRWWVDDEPWTHYCPLPLPISGLYAEFEG